MLNNNRVQRYNKKMTLKREKTKKSQMPKGRWDFYINMLYSAKKYRTKKVGEITQLQEPPPQQEQPQQQEPPLLQEQQQEHFLLQR